MNYFVIYFGIRAIPFGIFELTVLLINTIDCYNRQEMYCSISGCSISVFRYLHAAVLSGNVYTNMNPNRSNVMVFIQFLV